MTVVRNGELKRQNGELKKENDGEFIVKYKGEKYDISRFLKFHPGGRNYVAPYKGLSITNKLAHIDHSHAAMYLMNEYRMSDNKDDNDNLEELVDWNKPMILQVGKLGSHYKEWVSAPVDRKLRLFDSDILENMTVTPWYLVPMVWIPVFLWFLYFGCHTNQLHMNDVQGIIWAALGVIVGVVLWTLVEYSLHRWLFHLEPPATSPVLITLHFLMHGLHHKVPFDEKRLLFPPVPAGIVGCILYSIFTLVLPSWMFYFTAAGVTIGYITYDLMHFYLHYGSPSPGSHLYYMKRYHNQHHFTHHETGFGISSSVWDKIFGTQIFLRKLSRALKW